jgi:hypothetical protein
MMEIRFIPLFEVELVHNYYTSGLCKDIAIKPTVRCKDIMQDYGLIFGETAKGFAVFCEVRKEQDNKDHPLRPFDEPITLSFLLSSGNPFFLNYSELPLDGESAGIYHLHNINNNQQGGSILLTSDSGSPYLSQKDRIALKPRFFNYSFTSPDSSAELSITDIHGVQVAEGTMTPLDGSLTYPVDMRGRSHGRYALSVNGGEKLVFYMDDNLAKERVFGIIDIFAGADVPPANRFVESDGSIAAKSYSIKIDNRKTYWKYAVVLSRHPDIKAEDISITYADASTTFSRQAVQLLPDGKKSVPFISEGAIPLRDEPVRGIKLELAAGNGLLGIGNLPNAAISGIKPSPSGDKIFSEIFVYI